MLTKTRVLLTSLFVFCLLSGVWAAKKQEGISPAPTASMHKQEPSGPAPATRAEPLERVAPAGISAGYEIPWQSINGGGNPGTSASYMVNASVGQSTIGFATSTSYRAGIGYWYGTDAAGVGGCGCPFQSDFDADGFLTAIDLGMMIDILFSGSPDIQDPDCPSPRADFDCDGFSTALDLSKLIDHLFAGGAVPCDPCNP